MYNKAKKLTVAVNTFNIASKKLLLWILCNFLHTHKVISLNSDLDTKVTKATNERHWISDLDSYILF